MKEENVFLEEASAFLLPSAGSQQKSENDFSAFQNTGR